MPWHDVSTFMIGIVTWIIYSAGSASFFMAYDEGEVKVVSSIVPLYAPIPFLFGIIVMGEAVKIVAIVGAVLALASSFLMNLTFPS